MKAIADALRAGPNEFFFQSPDGRVVDPVQIKGGFDVRTSVAETCTFEQVLQQSADWCANNPAWIRICDLPDGYSDSLYVRWNELSAAQQRRWGSEFGYQEFATKRCKVPCGVVSGKGEFYERITDVPLFHNSMAVFRVGVNKANAMRAARTK
ncbi:hypothetical protein [Paraburkholderia fungorum]|uniref:hypothetical protein n=1 Tax=Paraburkholderia fungorum TaxID=134537 RepID=UPI0006963E9D|nr:hypothetical protein [Paraburkholderia fungorum]